MPRGGATFDDQVLSWTVGVRCDALSYRSSLGNPFRRTRPLSLRKVLRPPERGFASDKQP